MKRSGQNLGEMLDLVRENQPTQRLYTPDDLRELIGERGDAPAVSSAGRDVSGGIFTRSRLPVLLLSMAGVVVIGAFLLQTDEKEPIARSVAGAPVVDNVQHPSTSKEPTAAPAATMPSVAKRRNAVEHNRHVVERGGHIRARVGKHERLPAGKSIPDSGTPDGIAVESQTPVKKDEASKPARLHPGHMRFTRYSSDAADPERNRHASLTLFDEDIDIGGLRFIDLTELELARLNVRYSDAGLMFTMQQRSIIDDSTSGRLLRELGYDLGNPSVNFGFQVTADTFDVKYRELHSNELTDTSVVPVLYSSRWIREAGQEGLSMFFTPASPLLKRLDASAEHLREDVLGAYSPQSDDHGSSTTAAYHALNKLIPIRIRLQGERMIENTGKHRGAEILLWYVPTPEFVSALPDRYRVPLEKELKLIASVEKGNMPPGEACKRMPGEAVLMDFCRSGSGAIAYARAWPNPAREKLTFNYVLNEPRHISITLHDLSGKFLGELTPCGSQTAGQHQQSINLDDIASGTYLITLRTDQGEQSVQRIIVQ